MAKTQGHGNPNWTRDETILAMALFLSFGQRVPSKNAAEVAELSAFLRLLPYHRDAAKRPTFRNAEGVAFKLQNIRQVATGKGLGNVSKIDRAIWSEFKDRPDEVARLAQAIRAGVEAFEGIGDDSPAEEFQEGRLLTELHQRRERSPVLRRRLLRNAQDNGLRCEMCGLHRPRLPLPLQESMFEAHHNTPLASTGVRKTRVEDLSLLCASCHRLIHKLIATRGWLDVATAKRIVECSLDGDTLTDRCGADR